MRRSVWRLGGSLALPFIALITTTAAHDETRLSAEQRRVEIERRALAQADPTVEKLKDEDAATLKLKLIDSADDSPIPALVRITNVDDGKAIRLPNEIHRAANWFSLDAETNLRLPRRTLRIEAIHGLETERAERVVDLSDGSTTTVTLRLERFTDAKYLGLRAGNTHLHLRGLSIAEMDRYLRLVPQTDGLELVFVSYLRRAIEERDYTSNVLTTADLARLSTPNVQFGNGEEHRHNFGAGGQGYGHVMFLNIQKLIQPVSIGPGIMKEGTDGRPLKEGIEAARADGATVIWCHNRFGLEDVPNWLAERLQAQNIHDGGQHHGSYDETYYRYLNLGLRVPFSTGTDWFVYDFSRVYVPLEGALTPSAWLKELEAGRTFITNGPLLTLTIDGHTPGDVVKLDGPKPLRVRASGAGRLDFKGIELVRNGEVVSRAESRTSDGRFVAEIDTILTANEPGWYALRIPDQDQMKNELDQPLFAHTSPIYVEFGGKKIFDRATAETLLAELKAAPEVITKDGQFADDAERARVLDVYREAIRTLESRIKQND